MGGWLQFYISYLFAQICKTSCRTPAELRRHESTHDSSKKFQCTTCDAWLKSKATLRMHIKDVHERPTEPQIPCKVISRPFCNAHNLGSPGLKLELSFFAQARRWGGANLGSN